MIPKMNICFICLVLKHKDNTQREMNDEKYFQTFL